MKANQVASITGRPAIVIRRIKLARKRPMEVAERGRNLRELMEARSKALNADDINNNDNNRKTKQVAAARRWRARGGRHLLVAALAAALSMALVSDLSRMVRQATMRGSGGADSKQQHSGLAWASWIGEVPTAAELYSDAASEMPTTEAFDDDDEDEELDASATNEYPDNENDESYEDPEGDQESEQESRKHESWLRPKAQVPKTAAAQVGGHAVWSDLDGWRRNKRDLEDRLALASRRAAARRQDTGAEPVAAGSGAPGGSPGDDFNVEDGDEDAWVHDGIDDIQIDPETKRAASELSYDEKSIDAEYEPDHKRADGAQSAPVMNRTRITTITDVIPMSVEDAEDRDGGDGSRPFYAAAASNAAEPARVRYPPAAQLSLEQAQRLVWRNGQAQEAAAAEQRHLAAAG